MQNLTLFKIISTFSGKEMTSFEEFINSPLYNNADYVTKYYLKIKNYHPDFKDLKPEIIFKALYPDRKFSDSTIRRLNTELLKLAEKFLVITSLEKNKFLKENILLEELDKRNADTHFSKRLKRMQEEIEKETITGEKYYRQINDLNETEIVFLSKRDRKKAFDKYLSTIEAYDRSYTIQKLKKLISLSLEARIYSWISSDEKKAISYAKSVSQNNYFNLPVIRLLCVILLFSIEMHEKYFYELMEMLAGHKKEISKDELEIGYFLLLNFCTIEHNKGVNSYKNAELQIYKDMIIDDILLSNNILESIVYKNVISCALDAGDHEFASEFLEEYKKYLTDSEKDNIVSYCRANIAYSKKEYDEALSVLAKINFQDENQKLSLRVFNLKIFYERNMYEQAIAAIDAFKHTLKRKTPVSKSTIDLYLQFIIFYERMVKLKLKPDKVNAGLLKKEIKISDVISKNWLIREAVKL